MRRKELVKAAMKLLEEGKNPKQTARAIAAYLIVEKRTSELNSLLRDLEELRFARHDSLEVTATTARTLTEETKQHIGKLFDAKTIKIHEEINQEVLGGVKVRALDKVADFSVQARLQRLRRGV